MIRGLRKRLWLIGYYSATRERTVWSRWVERALFASIALAVPATLAMESLVTRSATAHRVAGRLLETEEGVLFAVLERGRAAGLAEANHVGDWTLHIARTERGWPFPSLRKQEPPRLDLNRFDQPGIEIDARLAADDPVRVAIREALARGDRADLAADWQAGSTAEQRRFWRGAVAGALAWWVSLSVASVIGIRLLALRSLFRRARRAEASAARASGGRCRGCDYDLRGLEFSERCPECGELL